RTAATPPISTAPPRVLKSRPANTSCILLTPSCLFEWCSASLLLRKYNDAFVNAGYIASGHCAAVIERSHVVQEMALDLAVAGDIVARSLAWIREAATLALPRSDVERRTPRA